MNICNQMVECIWIKISSYVSRNERKKFIDFEGERLKVKSTIYGHI